MTTSEKLVDQHIKEYESRLKHIDELFERAGHASTKFGDNHAFHEELQNYQREHSELVRQGTKHRKPSSMEINEEILRTAGPIGIWDLFAQKLEALVERMER